MPDAVQNTQNVERAKYIFSAILELEADQINWSLIETSAEQDSSSSKCSPGDSVSKDAASPGPPEELELILPSGRWMSGKMSVAECRKRGNEVMWASYTSSGALT